MVKVWNEISRGGWPDALSSGSKWLPVRDAKLPRLRQEAKSEGASGSINQIHRSILKSLNI